ncbi:hypothetical protein B0T26DRAFT_674312 [Lasiosphaeria miniovina]|uniref:Fungal lipase-type domain-containing protein n=1 Tax=Lasiosphaeria miniovina TaxID=1954250 RepID=A0AA40DZT0_9PEZI|nr:uncharacterized protein B0T26DRAFT_674312 [Lasiosphaeria miniovina]KAK0722629.1 hypothetical protein B0T26DRAFT_674312 [Lasiosphaeria miniovina]
MKLKLSKLFQRTSVQVTTQSSLAVSAAAPDSGFAFLQNSQGASAALNELSSALSVALQQINLDNNSTDDDGFVKTQLRRLETAVGRYENSRSISCRGLVEWKGSSGVTWLVSVAFSCAAAVYKTAPKSSVVHDSGSSEAAALLALDKTSAHRKPQVNGTVFREREYNRPSIGGTEKAIGVWTAAQSASYDGPPVLIIAVRGTARFVDSLVNLNGRPLAADEFLGTSHLSASHENKAVSVHGGAVASILYVKCLLEAAKDYPSLKLSCITFGAPPTFNTNLTKTLRAEGSLANSRGHTLAFVNEFDVVPRVDQSYVRSLIDLYRAFYNLGPLMADGVECRKNENYDQSESSDSSIQSYVLPPLEFQEDVKEEIEEEEAEHARAPVWKLPLPEYNNFGDMVLLRKDRQPVDATTPGDGRKNTSSRVLRAYTVPLEEYQRLLFCGTQTHSRSYYADRVELLRQGAFNERESW